MEIDDVIREVFFSLLPSLLPPLLLSLLRFLCLTALLETVESDLLMEDLVRCFILANKPEVPDEENLAEEEQSEDPVLADDPAPLPPVAEEDDSSSDEDPLLDSSPLEPIMSLLSPKSSTNLLGEVSQTKLLMRCGETGGFSRGGKSPTGDMACLAGTCGIPTGLA